MIAINTNGKLEYTYFCAEEYSTKIEKWLEQFESFKLQHNESIFVEIFPRKEMANFYFSTIPSERHDFGNRICDTSFAALDVKYNESREDDESEKDKEKLKGKEAFDFFKSTLLMYDIEQDYRLLGNFFDSEFTEEFYNGITKEIVHHQNTKQLVTIKLKNVYKAIKHQIGNIQSGIVPSVKENYCKVMPIENNRKNFVAALDAAIKETDVDKFVLMITSMTVNEEKVKKIFNTEDKTKVKALVYSTKAKEETTFEIKKKRMSTPTTVGVAAVLIGIAVAGLMIYLEPSKKTLERSEETSSTVSMDSLATSQENKSNVFLSPGKYTDGNLTLRVSDTLLQMFNDNDSLIQGFIFRCDSVRKVDE